MASYSCDQVGGRGTVPAGNAIYAYIRAAQMALSNHVTGDIRRSPKCPECGEIHGSADGKHILYMGFIIVGCKGYWVLDPNKIGIPRPSWKAVNGRVRAT